MVELKHTIPLRVRLSFARPHRGQYPVSVHCHYPPQVWDNEFTGEVRLKSPLFVDDSRAKTNEVESRWMPSEYDQVLVCIAVHKRKTFCKV